MGAQNVLIRARSRTPALTGPEEDLAIEKKDPNPEEDVKPRKTCGVARLLNRLYEWN
jgi:hypothetical protein